MNTNTTITTAARRIARESATMDAREVITFDADGKVTGRPWRSDSLRYDVMSVGRHVTQREAQDMLDAHAAGMTAAANADRDGMWEDEAYSHGAESYASEIAEARAVLDQLTGR